MGKRVFFPVFLAVCVMFVQADTGGAAWGAAAAKSDVSPTLNSMLRYAIEDEYLAHAEYEAIIAKFGAQKPFSNIIKAEVTHIGWLVSEFGSRGLAVPADEGKKYVVMPATLNDAFKAGVQAEIDNIAMYELFLKDGALAKAENKAVKDLFVRLRDASKNHLKAFENGLSR